MSSTVYTVSSSPEIRVNTLVQKNMRDVLIALLPAAAAGVYYLKTQALFVIFVSVLTCVGVEVIWKKLNHQEAGTLDLSAAVTGLLLGLNLSSEVPLWIPVIGGIFAIVFIKQFFGGLGQNFMNPTLAARAFLLASWSVPMTKMAIDAPAASDLWGLLAGPGSGYIGEVSVLALLIGGIYLIIKRVISYRVPLAFIGTVALLSWLLGGQGLMTGDPVRGIMSGGLMLGAFFMATDHSTSPSTTAGQYIMGVGCGMLTAVFRIYGNNNEGFVYAILIMNLFVPFIEKYTAPRVALEVA